MVEEERKETGAESAASAPSPREAAPPAAPAATNVVAGDSQAEGAGTPGGSPGGENGGAGAGEGGAPRKRRRGRRGGRRHKKKPAGENGASAENGNGNGDHEDGGGDDDAPKTERPSRPPQQRRPQQQRRTPRPAAADGAGASENAGPTESASASGPDAGGERPAAASAQTGDAPSGAGSEPSGDEQTATGPARPRRRRGGRGRGGGARKPAGENGENGDAEPKTAEPAAAAATPKPRSGGQGGGGGSRQGSTRLAAQKQRREQRPRRPRKRLSEGEARALRGESKTMLIHDHEDRTQIAVLEAGVLIEHFVAHQKSRTIVGNVYLGKVQNVLPSMEAAFVDVGRGRNAVLYAGEVNYESEDLEGDGPPPRIEQILKPGQPVMVQVTKDALGTKGARLTAQISLAGRYLVLAPEQNVSGISRRLAEDERSRLRQIFRDIKPKQHGVIVRTAAEGASREALERDLSNLLKVWDEVQKNKKTAKAPALLHAEPELVMRVVRDIFSGDFERVVVDSRSMFETIRGYLEEQGPDLIDRIELHEGPLPMLEQYHVTEQIHKALERKVWLPSGGSIVIDRTEAMTVIDVNTGKFVGKGGSLEDTVVKNNVEAAEEVARQLRLRDIGGIIVIDFIDMLLPANREQVLRTLKRALGRDKTRSQVFDVSSLGLVEMTRKRVSEGLLDAFSEPCPNCDGRGIVITHDID